MDDALNIYNIYTTILEEVLNSYSDEEIQAKNLLKEDQKQLVVEYINYISKKGKYCVLKNDEIYIKKEAIKESIDDYVSQKIYRKGLPSIYTICEYGVSIPIATRLHEAGLTIANIKEYPIILEEFLGECKANQVFDAIYKIKDYNIESIYLLHEYGVSKNIIDQMKNQNITMIDVKKNSVDTFGQKYNMGKHATKMIYEAVKKYISLSALKEDTKYPDIEMEIEKDDCDRNQTNYENNINPLTIDNINQAIEKTIKKDTYKVILKEYLKGRTLADIGLELNLSRERVRQIFNKAVNQLPKELDEDIRYKEIFCKYEWEEDAFTETFKVEKNVYNYLDYKYEKGTEDLVKILGTDYLDKEQEEVIKKHSKLITYNGMLIKEERYSLIKAILQEEGTQQIITDLVEKYHNVIKEYGFSNLEPIDSVRGVENALSRKNYIIASSKRRYRYYNYELLTVDDIEELVSLLDVDDGVYYADYFFRENPKLMNRLNILDENELYNMLKKYSKKENVIFSTMPIILIGYEEREQFFLEKMNNLSPIHCDEFINILNKEYGYKFDSTKAYVTKEFSKYITKGIISTEEKVFDDVEIKLLKQVLTRNIYAIKDLKIILKELFQRDCSDYIRSINFEKLGYRIREQYILKTDAGPIDKVLEDIVLKNEIFDLSKSNIKSLGQSFQWILYELMAENKIIKYENNLYYTNKWLDKNGITNTIINEFKKKIYNSFGENEIFTLYNIKQKELMSGYEILEINDVFIESIVKSIKGIKYVSVENNIIFLKSEVEFFNKADFIEKIILDNSISRVKDIKELLQQKYDINIELSQVKELIDLKKYEMEDATKEENKLEEESIENADDNYSISMCLKYLEKVYGLGIKKNFSSDRNSEFLKRFDNALNTLTQKEKIITILKHGLKDGKIRTAEEVAQEIGIVSTSSVGRIDKRTIQKLQDKERTKILRTYFNFETTDIDDSTADFILNLL